MPMIESYAGAAGSQTQNTQREHPYNLRQALERFERSYLHNILVLADWDIGYTNATKISTHAPECSKKVFAGIL